MIESKCILSILLLIIHLFSLKYTQRTLCKDWFLIQFLCTQFRSCWSSEVDICEWTNVSVKGRFWRTFICISCHISACDLSVTLYHIPLHQPCLHFFYFSDLSSTQFVLWNEMNFNMWWFRPRFYTLRLYWSGDNLGYLDEFCYESCPHCTVDRSSRSPAN